MGGKSRKAGGTSKKLRAALRQGRLPNWKAKKPTRYRESQSMTNGLFDDAN